MYQPSCHIIAPPKRVARYSYLDFASNLLIAKTCFRGRNYTLIQLGPLSQGLLRN